MAKIPVAPFVSGNGLAGDGRFALERIEAVFGYDEIREWPDAEESLWRNLSLDSGLPKIVLTMGPSSLARRAVSLEDAVFIEENGLRLDIDSILEIAGATGRAVVSSSSAGNVFRKEGDFWLVRYEGRPISLKASKGAAYLAVLLAKPHRDVSARDLILAIGGIAPSDPKNRIYGKMADEQLAEAGLTRKPWNAESISSDSSTSSN